jgi:hypothetical protein
MVKFTNEGRLLPFKKEGIETNDFRLNAKKLFLTYSQTDIFYYRLDKKREKEIYTSFSRI